MTAPALTVETATGPFPTDHTATALVLGIGEQILDVLAGRRTTDQIRDRIAKPVAGWLKMTKAMQGAESPDYRLRSVHACQTDESTVEACMIVNVVNRVRALALRLEQADTRWKCTVLSLL